MWREFKFVVLFFHAILTLSNAAHNSHCIWNKRPSSDPEVYWINMDKSTARKVDIELHLNRIGFRHYRSRGLSSEDVYFPEEVMSNWHNDTCTLGSNHVENKNETFKSSSKKRKVKFSAICGNSKRGNQINELLCTAAHLNAIRTAIYSPTARSRYALIVEDDIFFPFNIDFKKMVKSAPNDFGILQLFNSKTDSIHSSWADYVKNGTLWIKRSPNGNHVWSTGAYLIDRKVLRSTINAIVIERGGLTEITLAGVNVSSWQCQPANCCVRSKTKAFTAKLPCIFAPLGLQADHFIYMLAPTYLLTVPIVTESPMKHISTIHTNHTEIHEEGFQALKEHIHEMISGRVLAPPFLTVACRVS